MKGKGFTLIELLVVIAIIAVLSTIVMTSTSMARMKARDARRISDMKELQAALEQCFDPTVGYPRASGGPILLSGAASTVSLGPNTPCADGKKFSDYMNEMPDNPWPGGATYTYCSSAITAANGVCNVNQGASYQIYFKLEAQAGSLVVGDHYVRPSGIN